MKMLVYNATKAFFPPLKQVFGVGVPNPYRLRPFLGARVPVNSSFSPIINIHNPHSEPLQVSFCPFPEGKFNLHFGGN